MRQKNVPPLFDALMVSQQQLSEQEMIVDPYGNRLPLVLFRDSGGWADGDVSLPALERLAGLILGDCMMVRYGPKVKTLKEEQHWKMQCGCYIPGYERYYYRCVSSGIVDGRVWGVYMYESCLMDFTRYRDRDEQEDQV